MIFELGMLAGMGLSLGIMTVSWIAGRKWTRRPRKPRPPVEPRDKIAELIAGQLRGDK